MADHPLLAAAYDTVLAPAEARGLAAQRHGLLGAARGRVLEVGAGTGLNLAHYHTGSVTSVVVSEPDGAMRARLRARLARRAGRAEVAPLPVEVISRGVPGIGYPERSFDTVVCTLVLCTLEDLAGGLTELRRVVRDDGQLLFLEHVLGRPVLARAQRLVAPAWARLAGGCRLDRDAVAAIREAGFVVTDCERLAPLGPMSAGAMVRGRAMVRGGGAGSGRGGGSGRADGSAPLGIIGQDG